MNSKKSSRVNVRVSSEQMKALAKIAQYQSSSKSSVVRFLINQYIVVNNG